MINSNNIKVFVDFDGTITHEDIGANLFKHFSDEVETENIINSYRNGNINAIKCWEELSLISKNVTVKSFEEFINNYSIDSTFSQFVNFCKEKNIELFILSDGFDSYIDHILNKYNLANINYYSNKLIINDNGKLELSFPFTDEECKNCANCKRNHIITNSSEEDITVYIGNGISDFCPVQYCDIIFAKDNLLKFCEKERISFFPFRNFNEIEIRLNEILKKKNIKKRHQAELKRRSLYLQG